MKKNLYIVPSIITASILLTGCSGGGGTNTTNTDSPSVTDNNTNISGTVIDGYVRNATVFIDLNNNKILDDNEPYTNTDNNGNFTIQHSNDIDTKNATVISTGGIDNTTNESFKGIMEINYNSRGTDNKRFITPISTLISKVAKNDGSSLSAAKDKVSKLLDIPTFQLETDPIKMFDTNPNVYKESIKLIKIAEAINTNTGNEISPNIVNQVFEEISKQINNIDSLKDINSIDINNQPTVISDIVNIVDSEVNKINDIPKDGEGYSKTLESLNVFAFVVGEENIPDYNKVEDWGTIKFNVSYPNAIGYNISNNNSNIMNTDIDENTGSVTLSSKNNGYGNATITVSASLNGGGTITESFNFNIEPSNDEPILTINPLTITLDEDTNTVIPFVIFDKDKDNVNISTTNPSNGTISVDNNINEITYTPNANYYGQDSFTVTANDGNGGVVTKTVELFINSTSDTPITDILSNYSMDEDNTLNANFTITSLDEGVITNNIIKQPSKGTVNIDSQTGTLQYIPNTNENGNDDITVEFLDGKGGKLYKRIDFTINPINDEPILNVPSNVVTNEDTPIIVDFSETDVDLDNLIVTASATANASIQINNETNQITYSPNENWFGTETITFTIDDGTTTTSQTIQFDVVSVNDLPTLTANDKQTVDEDTELVIPFDSTDVEDSYNDLSIGFTNPSKGTIVFDKDAKTYSYTPTLNFFGEDSFEMKITDTNGGETTKKIDITINAVNDAPVLNLNKNGTQTIIEDSNDSFTFSFSDVDSEILTFTAGNEDSNFKGNVSISYSNDEKTEGTVSYTPETNFFGNESFNISVSDGDITTTETINMNVTPINDNPVITTSSDKTEVIIGKPTNFSATIEDVDNDNHLVEWQVTSKPIDSNPILNNIYSLNPTATFDKVGEYILTAIANDQESENNLGNDTIKFDVPFGWSKLNSTFNENVTEIKTTEEGNVIYVAAKTSSDNIIVNSVQINTDKDFNTITEQPTTTALDFDITTFKDIPYIVYSNTGTITIKKYSASSWVNVGNTIAMTDAENVNIAYYQDNLFVSYVDTANKDLKIKMLAGDNWVDLPNNNIFNATNLLMDIDKTTGVIYFTFKNTVTGYNYVYTYQDGVFDLIGNNLAAETNLTNVSMDVDNNVLLITLSESDKTNFRVLQYRNGTWGALSTEDLALNGQLSSANVNINGEVIDVSYIDNITNAVVVKTFDKIESKWNTVANQNMNTNEDNVSSKLANTLSTKLLFNITTLNKVSPFYLETNKNILIDTVPSDNSKDVSVDSDIVFNFTKNINPDSVNINNFVVTDSSNEIVGGDISVSNGTITFSPSQNLKFGEEYHVNVNNNILDTNGKSINEKNYINFKSESRPEIYLTTLDSSHRDVRLITIGEDVFAILNLLGDENTLKMIKFNFTSNQWEDAQYHLIDNSNVKDNMGKNDLVVKKFNNEIYVGYINNSGNGVIKKLTIDGWQQFGVTFANNINSMDFEVDSNNDVLVSYTNSNSFASVSKYDFDNETWSILQMGASDNISSSPILGSDISLINNKPYLAFVDDSNVLHLYSHDGSDWSNEVMPTVSTNGFIELFTKLDGKLYVSYFNSFNKITVAEVDLTGKQYINKINSTYQSSLFEIVDSFDKNYIVYVDDENSSIAVDKYNQLYETLNDNSVTTLSTVPHELSGTLNNKGQLIFNYRTFNGTNNFMIYK